MYPTISKLYKLHEFDIASVNHNIFSITNVDTLILVQYLICTIICVYN